MLSYQRYAVVITVIVITIMMLTITPSAFSQHNTNYYHLSSHHNLFNQNFSHSPYTVCFTPNQHCSIKIIEAINEAQKTIHLQAYTFTSWSISNALVRAKRRGVEIIALLDKSNVIDHNKAILALQHGGIPLFIDDRVEIAHNKVMIIDQKIVITGSFNFTYAADHYNAENVLLIKNSLLATTYDRYFNSRLAKSKPLAQYHLASSTAQSHN